MRRPLLVAACLAVVALAGCLAATDEPVADPGLAPGGNATSTAPLTFTEPKLIDDTRAGGEPVIAVTPKGTLLVASHPGSTHVHPDPRNPAGAAPAVIPTQGQVYLWRSTDNGSSWEHVSLLPEAAPDAGNSGPRGAQGHGVSDPDLSVDESTGRIWLTDLEAAAEASVSWSDDDGRTWLMGNDVASRGVVDRQWLASHDGTAYFTARYFSPPARYVLASENGIVWEQRGQLPSGCGSDFVADPATGHLLAGCGGGIAVSTDGGRTWEARKFALPGGSLIGDEPAVDAAGNVHLAATANQEQVVYGVSEDEGRSWTVRNLTGYFPELANGTAIWPWTSAGSRGRAAVTFYGSPRPDATTDPEAKWYVYSAVVVDATSADPAVHPAKLTPEPIHVGAVCQSGTLCQGFTATSEQGDRRLGDFFETTVDHQGRLHVVYADTQRHPGHWVSHVGYVRQTGGPSLIDGSTPSGFPTQG